MKGVFVMEEMGTSGVESASIESTPVAAEQGSQVETTAVSEGAGTPTTGESTPAAGESTGTEDKTEIAFAKRLAKEREKIEAEVFAKAQQHLMSNDPTMKFGNKIAKENGMTPCSNEKIPITVKASNARAIVDPKENATLRKRRWIYKNMATNAISTLIIAP